MDTTTTLLLLTAIVLGVVSNPNPSPQHFSLPFPQEQQYNAHFHKHSVYPGAQHWPKSEQKNFNNPSPSYINHSPSPAAEDILKNNVPNQPFYEQPPPQYPQIYKMDNLIIIANPQPQEQACTPQKLPPSGVDVDDNRLGKEPSKCAWAVFACCSPGNHTQFTCFELLGCPGVFFENDPCDPKMLVYSANSVMKYYRTLYNGTADN